MEISKESINKFRQELKIALRPLEEKFGLKIELPRISYSTKEFHGTLKCFVINSNGEKLADIQSKEEFDMYTYHSKLRGAFNFEFIPASGNLLRVIGFNPSRSKNPVELLDVKTNKRYKGSENFVDFYFRGGIK